MRVSKDTEVFVRGVGYVKVSKIFEMLKDGNEVTVRGSYDEWTNIKDAWMSSNRSGIHLVTKDGVDYIIGDTTNILTVVQRDYCLASKEASKLNKNSIVVHNYTVVDEELGIRYRDDDLRKLALIYNYCTTRIKDGLRIYTFTSSDKSVIDDCYSTFLEEKDKNKITITEDSSGVYKFSVSYRRASLVKEILQLFMYNPKNKMIPNTIFCSDKDSRIRFCKYLKPFHFGEYKKGKSKTEKYLTGFVSSVNKNELVGIKRFVHTLGINSKINYRGYLYACILSIQDAIRLRNMDFNSLPTHIKTFTYSAPMWGVSGIGGECPASNKDTFIVNKNKSFKHYDFLNEFYKYHQPLKVKSVEEVFCDMIELEVEDYVDIGGIFVK